MPPEQRHCACGCGTTFTTRNPSRRYLHPTHRPPKPNRGAAHGRAARLLLATLTDGTPCPRCGQPMTHTQRARGQLDAGHTIDRILGGTLPDRVEHRACNRSAGATLGNSLRGVVTSRRW